MKRAKSEGGSDQPESQAGSASDEEFQAELPAYVEELDRRLMDQPENCMPMSMLDGYLTGVILCPKLLAPSTWISGIWMDGEGSEEPAGGEEELDDLIELIMTHYAAIVDLLEQAGYRPIFDVDTRNGDTIWESWMIGFETAMRLAPEAWYRMVQSTEDCEAAGSLIAALAMISDGTSDMPEDAQHELTLGAPDIIPHCVETFYVEQMRSAARQPIRSNKVGRNEPCPCGSGRKYKKCCGLN